MNGTYTRRGFFKKAVTFGISSLLATSFGYFYARFIEPKRITITKHDLSHQSVPSGFDGIKIVQFSDTHIGHNFELEQLAKCTDAINKLKPDLIFFTGDLIDEPNRYPFAESIPPILSKLRAPLGKFAIYGNHDHGGYGTNLYKGIMEASGFEVLINEGRAITFNNSDVWIAGLDDLMLGKPDYDLTLSQIPEGLYSILLAHEPDAALKTSQYNISLQLSGHSHGGQIQLPFIGPLITPPFAKHYFEGFYNVDGLKLFVNRGMGTTREPYRFLSPPEITLFTLRRKP